MDATTLKTQNAWLEESLGSTEPLVTDGDDLPVRKLIRLLQAGALRRGLNFFFKVNCHIAELLLDIADNFTFCGGREGVATLSQDLHHVICQITPSHIDTEDGMGKSETFVDGDHVSNTITRIQHDTSCATRGVERKHRLDGDVESWGVECLKDDLGHLFAIGLGVDGCFCEEDGVLFGSDTQLIVESVMPNLLHIIPVGDDTMLDRVSESKDTALRLCFVPNIGVFLTHADHDTSS